MEVSCPDARDPLGAVLSPRKREQPLRAQPHVADGLRLSEIALRDARRWRTALVLVLRRRTMTYSFHE